jgi:hypothetical protein
LKIQTSPASNISAGLSLINDNNTEYKFTNGSLTGGGIIQDHLQLYYYDNVNPPIQMVDITPTGDVSVTAGDVYLSNDKEIRAGSFALLAGGATPNYGVTSLVAGTKVVTAPCKAGDLVFLQPTSLGGTPGFLSVNAGAGSFTITSSSNLDTSTVSWMLVPIW